jgi:hypothetical protein
MKIDGLLIALCAVAAVAIGLAAASPAKVSETAPVRSTDAEFMRACLSHRFAADQCEFFRFGPEGKPASELSPQ